MTHFSSKLLSRTRGEGEPRPLPLPPPRAAALSGEIFVARGRMPSSRPHNVTPRGRTCSGHGEVSCANNGTHNRVRFPG
jgi:hypothetical protein